MNSRLSLPFCLYVGVRRVSSPVKSARENERSVQEREGGGHREKVDAKEGFTHRQMSGCGRRRVSAKERRVDIYRPSLLALSLFPPWATTYHPRCPRRLPLVILRYPRVIRRALTLKRPRTSPNLNDTANDRATTASLDDICHARGLLPRARNKRRVSRPSLGGSLNFASDFLKGGIWTES